jgi:beta-galactosidase
MGAAKGYMKRREFIGAAAAGLAAFAVPMAPWKLLAAGSEGETRQRKSFNDGWLFHRQAHGGGALGSFDRNATFGTEIEPKFREAAQVAYDDSDWESIFVPHTWNAFDTGDDTPGYFRGIGWYRKHFRLGEDHRGKRIFLEFEGVNQVCEIWLNGVYLGIHQGGYTTFELDITEHAHVASAENVLSVKVDNVYNPNISPTVKTDLTFYGGIYRNVWLQVTDPVYCSTLYWRTPQLSEASAEVEVYAAVTNTTTQRANLSLVCEVFDPEGQLVGKTNVDIGTDSNKTSDLVQRSLKVTNPRLWHPESPSLYRIRATIFEKISGRRVDSLEVPLGLRWFSFDANQGFFLNGKRLQLRGTTWHQSYPGMGDALPDSRHFADMKIIRDMGCNFFRTSHYPHAPAVIKACDQLGLLVLEEMFVGDEVETNPDYVAIQSKGAEEMILRDRNNPSVIMWGMAGEVDEAEKSASMVAGLLNRYRELDPSRVVTMHAPRAEKVIESLDVVGLYSTFQDDDRDHKNHPGRKYLIEEYTAAGMGRGLYGMGPESEDLGCVEHEKFLSQVNLRPWIAGSVLWHQFDYDGEEYDPVIPHVVTFGIADSWRIPKDAYYFYQSQWGSQPMVHICGHWTWPDEMGAKRSVKVYSNLEEVELFLNGRSLGTKSGDTYAGLAHAPRIWEVPYEPGTLEAVARSGSQIAKDARKTAGPAARVDVSCDVKQIRSGDRESFAYFEASVVDKDGTVVPSAFQPITFTSYGPGELLPQIWAGHEKGFTWNAVAGKTGIAFRSTDRVGRARISAYSPGLALGRAEIELVAKGRQDEIEYRGGATVYK